MWALADIDCLVGFEKAGGEGRTVISWLRLGQQYVLFNKLDAAIHGPDFCEKVHIGCNRASRLRS
jgi:hypothetical protein